MSEWISVEQRLPELISPARSENVLVVRDCGQNSVASIDVTFMWSDEFSFKGMKWQAEHNGYRVTHWMPLPELPK